MMTDRWEKVSISEFTENGKVNIPPDERWILDGKYVKRLKNKEITLKQFDNFNLYSEDPDKTYSDILSNFDSNAIGCLIQRTINQALEKMKETYYYEHYMYEPMDIFYRHWCQVMIDEFKRAEFVYLYDKREKEIMESYSGRERGKKLRNLEHEVEKEINNRYSTFL